MEELQQKIASISQELAMFQMHELERNNALEKRIKELETSRAILLANQISDFEKRIKILEEARLRQISLNSTFVVKDTSKIDKPATTYSIWDLFKK